jgi:hypothetical protein
VSDFGPKKPAKRQNKRDSDVLSAYRHRTFDLNLSRLIAFKFVNLNLRALEINRLAAPRSWPPEREHKWLLDQLLVATYFNVGSSLSAFCYFRVWEGCP